MKKLKDLKSGTKFKIFPRGEVVNILLSKGAGEATYQSTGKGKRKYIVDWNTKGILVK